MMESPVKSADRVMVLIEQIGAAGSLSHTELAELLHIPKSSLSQLLKTLMARNWVVFDQQAKGYALGDALLGVARQKSVTELLIGRASRLLAELTAATGETSALNLRTGMYAEVASTEQSAARLTTAMRLGNRAPLHVTSGGKAILAHLPPDEIEAYLAQSKFERFTHSTLVTAEAVRENLELTRRRGFATAPEDFTPGVMGIAVPIISPRGDVLGAVNVAMPMVRHSPASERLALIHLKKVAEALATSRGGDIAD